MDKIAHCYCSDDDVLRADIPVHVPRGDHFVGGGVSLRLDRLGVLPHPCACLVSRRLYSHQSCTGKCSVFMCVCASE